MAYMGCTTRIVINKQLSDNIQVLSSVKQGCPASALLFAIYLEPLCQKVIQNDQVRGFHLMSAEVKILSYADDIAVFCEDRESIREALNDVKFFCDCTDSRVNWSKCLGIWHGNWQNTPSIFESITWKVIPDKYLGVPLQHYRDTTEYWKQETEQLRDKTKTWGGRDFSMFTRSTVSNIFLISRVWYVLQVLFMSRVAVQKLHRVIAVFIWASTWERTRRTNLFRSVKSVLVLYTCS